MNNNKKTKYIKVTKENINNDESTKSTTTNDMNKKK